MRQGSGRIRQLGLLLLVSAMAVAVVSAVALANRDQVDVLAARDQGSPPLSREQVGDTEPHGSEQQPLTSDDCPNALGEGQPTHDGITREVLTPEALAVKWLTVSDLETRYPDIRTDVVTRTDVRAQIAFKNDSAGTVAMIFYEKDPEFGWLTQLVQECS